ncbi:MAG TPA: glycosyl hydrolase, partial [Verrucomicrobiae bacterium]
LLGMEDTNFLALYGPMARLVAKEYANWDRTDTNFPFMRTFEVWEGHSWAGGFSSGGGNNQESSSEAMNSWVGLFLLGNQMGDSAMTAAGAMGYAVESAAVNEYWQDSYRTNFPASYGKGMCGIVTSGGLAYGTYFSGDPAWIYGIQWVPANHWNNYLSRDKTYANWQLTNMWAERVTASAIGLNGFTLSDANNAVSQGEYLGNYILGFQTLFDQDGVAAILDAAYATNAPLATGVTYPGVSYYLTHSLRGLGDQDPNFYASLPASAIYYNARTGYRTYVLYNPAPTNQSVTIYSNGIAVDQVTAIAGKLTSLTPGQTNVVPSFQVSIQRGGLVAWPTTVGQTWTLQSAAGSGSPVWSNIQGPTSGNGLTNTYFDPAWTTVGPQYRTVQVSSGQSNLVVNSGFELGSGTNATGWSAGGSQPPIRTGTQMHNGSWSMQIYVTNTVNTPNNSEADENIGSAGGPAVVAGTAYTLSFWVRAVANGPSYVQNYGVSWRDGNNAQVGFYGWNGFSAGTGGWTQITATNLVAPANAVNAIIQIYGTTGAVTGGNGGVYLDDISFAYAVPGTTNVVAASVQPAMQLNWPGSSGASYDLQCTGSLPAAWSNLVTGVAGGGGTNSLLDLPATNNVRLYRVLQH